MPAIRACAYAAGLNAELLHDHIDGAPVLDPDTQDKTNQLLINERKLAAIESRYPPGTEGRMGPLPVTRLHGSVCFTDGHARAFLLWKRGVATIRATWDDGRQDIQTYLVCLAWCDEAGIRTVADLAGHVVDDDIYKREWIARCDAIGAGEKDT